MPPVEDESFVTSLAKYAADAVGSGERIVVNCLSGRGRSGTMIAIIAAMVAKAESVGDVVDLIVSLRRSRDGLVETPQQFSLIVRLLGLGDTSVCSMLCRVHQGLLDVVKEKPETLWAFILGILLTLALAGIMSSCAIRLPPQRREKAVKNIYPNTSEQVPLLDTKRSD